MSRFVFGTLITSKNLFLELAKWGMREIGYGGQITFELCHPVLNERHEIENLDFVQDQVQMAQEFMREIINGT